MILILVVIITGTMYHRTAFRVQGFLRKKKLNGFSDNHSQKMLGGKAQQIKEYIDFSDRAVYLYA